MVPHNTSIESIDVFPSYRTEIPARTEAILPVKTIKKLNRTYIIEPTSTLFDHAHILLAKSIHVFNNGWACCRILNPT